MLLSIVLLVDFCSLIVVTREHVHISVTGKLAHSCWHLKG